MKLGLVIINTNDGVEEAISINKDESWAYYTGDVRSAICRLENFDETSKSVLLVRFLGEKGYLLTIIVSRPQGSGRGGDNTAAWIHVPANCDISNKEIISVIHDVKEAISAPKGINKDLLDSAFGKDYNPKDVLSFAISTIESNTKAEYAARFYNEDYTLKELMDRIAQQEYANYKAVFFIDAKAGIETSCKELTFRPKSICRLQPLESVDGFICYLSQNEHVVPFDKAIEVTEGTTVSVVWKKDGYSDINKSTHAQNSEICTRFLTISSTDYRRKVTRDFFIVSSEDNQIVPKFKVRINGKLMDGDSMLVPESACKQGVRVTVNAEGYAEYKDDNVHFEDKFKNIKLRKKVHHYEFSIPVYAENEKLNAKGVIDTPLELSESSIKGYYLLNNEFHEGEGPLNYLEYKGRSLDILIGVAIGIVSCILGVMAYFGIRELEDFGGYSSNTETQQGESSSDNHLEDKIPSENAENTDSIDAVNYLSNNSMWHKDRLDSYETTHGLFEELNTFDAAAILKRIEKTGKIQRLTEIQNAFDQYSSIDHRIGKENHGGNYNSPSDKEINIANYVKWISEKHKPYQPPKKIQETNSNHTPQKNHITDEVVKTSGAASTKSSKAKQSNASSTSSKPSRGGKVYKDEQH